MSTLPPPQHHVLQDYAPRHGGFDEFLTEGGKVRVHAQAFATAIQRMGQTEFARRWEQSQRLVHANGFAYSGYATPQNKPRPWELDALPLLISANEWKAVSAALEQRARVLNLALKDLYGKQTLISRGVLPRELIFSHPGFLRSYHGQQLTHDRFLHFYAADMARSPNGDWWVLADRTEAPSGLGYALENRIVISRMLPDVFQRCQVKRLAPFFIAAQRTLVSLAQQHRDNPRVVLLSHGPTSRNYFEDAYLARYLGYTLVEGGDLTVRNSQVMLKTLGGLLPVDVILRRQNSNACDPLELDATSTLGVAGLTQAVRGGHVSVANGLGSGLIESTALMAFLPQISQALLGEDLQMPNVATWWCGQAESLNYVLHHLDDLIIQPAFRGRGHDGPLRASLLDMPSEQLAETIRACPSAYVAQERVMRSTVPVWDQKLQPKFLSLRGYVVANEDSFVVMQGALARTSSELDPLDMSIRKGEGSKDTWVLSDGPVAHVTLLDTPGQAIELRRGGVELPSRVADNLFWLGRQIERADAFSRLLKATANRMVGEANTSSASEILVLLRCLADQGQIEPGYALDAMRGQLPPIDDVLPTAVFDRSYEGCLRSVLDEMFRLGSIVRDRMSLDTWRIIHRIDEGFQPAPGGQTNIADLLAMIDELLIDLAAFCGMVRESMTRTQAYRFLELGRRLERAERMVNLLKNCFIPVPETLGSILESVLEIADSLMTYRSRYLANLQLGAVLDLLLTDETNPRSLAYQFLQIAEHVEQLPRQHTQPGHSTEQRLAMSLLHSIRMVEVQAVAEVHNLGDYSQLGELIENYETQLPQLAETLSHRYLVHAAPATQLAEILPQ